VVQYTDDGSTPVSDAARLQAALEALAVRDQVLADRNRRLAALEDTATRLAGVAARLAAAEEELLALRRARQGETAQYEARLASLEARLSKAPVTGFPEGRGPAETDNPPEQSHPALVARLEEELTTERRRNFRLNGRAAAPAAAEAERLDAALAEAHRRAAALERELAEMRAARDETGAYAYWEAWFRRRLTERAGADQARDQEVIRHQRAVLEEKERLIATLIERLRAVGEVSEGPDDLKEVVGIGPVIEELLHSLGITTFEQLAALTPEELDRIGDRLGAFHERISRDRWTEQAAELARRRVRLASGLSLG
jgi:predicted flap endonuclease-1-like 5' DNA nuclease